MARTSLRVFTTLALFGFLMVGCSRDSMFAPAEADRSTLVRADGEPLACVKVENGCGSHGTASGDGDIINDRDSDLPGTRSEFRFEFEGGGSSIPTALENGNGSPHGRIDFVALGREFTNKPRFNPMSDDIRFSSEDITLVQVELANGNGINTADVGGPGTIYARGLGNLTMEGETEGGWAFCLYAEDNAPDTNRAKRFRDYLDMRLWEMGYEGNGAEYSCENPQLRFKGRMNTGDIDAEDEGTSAEF